VPSTCRSPEIDSATTAALMPAASANARPIDMNTIARIGHGARRRPTDDPGTFSITGASAPDPVDPWNDAASPRSEANRRERRRLINTATPTASTARIAAITSTTDSVFIMPDSGNGSPSNATSRPLSA
jgi:hypothetical protein